MPTLQWIGKEKVINHHLEVPIKVLEHQYGFNEQGKIKTETGSGNKKTEGNFDNQAKIKINHEYILCYCKTANLFGHPKIVDPNIKEGSKLFKDEIRNTIVKNGPKNPISEVVLPLGFPSDLENGVIEARTNSWPH